jgi:MYXO-CTERM domain-containing protein
MNSLSRTGTEADAEWALVVRCVKEVYSPYNVVVTDVKPISGVGYHEAIIAGFPAEIGFGTDILGVAPLASDCSAIDNVISFTFANAHPATSDRVFNICWTAAQESAHAYGLDHEYEFVDGKRSACSDPMTYRNDCGGQKFFRNDFASCGETANRPCKCGAQQNSHLKILSVFGAGTPITGNPTIVLTNPAMSGDPLDRVVSAKAGAQRGVARVELLFNGYKWAEAVGAPFGRLGQPNPSDYAPPVPAALPNSIVDIKMIAYDDLGASTESAVVTVTKGAACATASTCASGQKCEAGKCFWDPPTGQLGASCSYAQFCTSGICTGTKDQQICTQNCIPGVVDSCPMGFECLMSTANSGVCFFTSSGGCCSVDRTDRGWWVHLGLGAALLGYVMRRRRR